MYTILWHLPPKNEAPKVCIDRGQTEPVKKRSHTLNPDDTANEDAAIEN
jgi:hypothetical protein